MIHTFGNWTFDEKNCMMMVMMDWIFDHGWEELKNDDDDGWKGKELYLSV